MKKIIKLTEKDISQIVKKILQEQRNFVQGLPPIKKGDSGEEVRNYQQRLLNIGYDLGPRGADGVFGSRTEKAVKHFQTTQKLPATGVIDQQTRNLMGLAPAGKIVNFPQGVPTLTPVNPQKSKTVPTKTTQTSTKDVKKTYKITPRIDQELDFVKQRGLDDKPFFIYDPEQNLIYLFNKGAVLVDYTTVVDGKAAQTQGKEYGYTEWCRDSGLVDKPTICTDPNIKSEQECNSLPKGRQPVWKGTFCKINPIYGALPEASRFFPKGIYDIRFLTQTAGYEGTGGNTFSVFRPSDNKIIPNAIHGIPNTGDVGKQRLKASAELEKFLQKNVETGTVPEKYLANTKGILNANQSFGCVGVPAAFINNPKVKTLGVGARLFVMGEGKDFLVQNASEYFNKLNGGGESCVNPESLASRMSSMA